MMSLVPELIGLKKLRRPFVVLLWLLYLSLSDDILIL